MPLEETELLLEPGPLSAPFAYVVHHYGDMWLGIEAARLLADEAARQLDLAWSSAQSVTTEQRGRVAVAVAAAKAQATRVSLDVSVRILDVMGAGSTTRRAAMDRFFRNARTHTRERSRSDVLFLKGRRAARPACAHFTLTTCLLYADEMPDARESCDDLFPGVILIDGWSRFPRGLWFGR